MIEQVWQGQPLNPQNIVSIIDNFNPVGLGFFNNHIKKKQVAHFFTQNVINILRTDKWIVTRTFNQKWKQIFKCMIQCEAKSIDLDNNKYKYVIGEVIHIKFCVLKDLNLFNNKIQNVQSLALLNAPNLKKLNLIYNEITNLDALSKCSFQLQSLWMYSQTNNKISSLVKSKSKLKQLGLQFSNYNCVICEDLSHLIKLSDSQESNMVLKTKTNKRISQQKIANMLNNKYHIRLEHLAVADPQINLAFADPQINI